MKGRNALLIGAVALITALPLWLVSAPPGAEGGRFGGADDQARQAIGRVAPDYRPWLAPLLQPASTEIASLLFALQAALGAGVIGYWLGVSVTRDKYRGAAAAECQAARSSPVDRDQPPRGASAQRDPEASTAGRTCGAAAGQPDAR